MPERFGDFFRRLLAVERDPSRLVSLDLRDEAVHVVVRSQTPVAARGDLLGQVSQPYAELQHATIRRREQRLCGDLRAVEIRPEQVSSARVVVPERGGVLPGCRATEHDAETGRQIVGQLAAHLRCDSHYARGAGLASAHARPGALIGAKRFGVESAPARTSVTGTDRVRSEPGLDSDPLDSSPRWSDAMMMTALAAELSGVARALRPDRGSARRRRGDRRVGADAGHDTVLGGRKAHVLARTAVEPSDRGAPAA